MKTIVLSIFLVCTGAQLKAENRHLIDSIRFDLKQKKRFYIGFDGKNNIVSSLNLKMFGLQGGYIYNNRTSLYIGLYNTYDNNNTNILNNPTAPIGKTDSNTVYESYGMGYINFGIEYIFLNSKRWLLSTPVAIGIGAGRYKQIRQDEVLEHKTPGIKPLEFGINASYKLTWWVWLGAGLGTRISINKTHAYNGPFYSFGLQIKTGEMIKRINKALDNRKK